MHRTSGEELAELSVCSWATHQIPVSYGPTLCKAKEDICPHGCSSKTHKIVVNDPLKRQKRCETLVQISKQFIAVVNSTVKVSKTSAEGEAWKQGGDMFRHEGQSVCAVYSERCGRPFHIA